MPLKFPCPLCAGAVITAEHEVGEMFRCPYCGGVAGVPESAAPTEDAPTLRRYVPPPEPEPAPAPPPEPQGPRPWGVRTVIKYIVVTYFAAGLLKILLFLIYWGALAIAKPDASYSYKEVTSSHDLYFTAIIKLLGWAFSVWLIYHIVKVKHKDNFYEALRIIRPSRAAAFKYGVCPALILVLAMIGSKFIFPPSFLHLPPGSPISGRFIIVMLPVLIGTTITAVVSPVAEELIFRGFIYMGLRRQMKVLWAATITTVLFFVIHLPFNNLTNATLIGLLAVALMVARIRTNSTTVPMILHYIYNISAMAAGWITAFMAN